MIHDADNIILIVCDFIDYFKILLRKLFSKHDKMQVFSLLMSGPERGSTKQGSYIFELPTTPLLDVKRRR